MNIVQTLLEKVSWKQLIGTLVVSIPTCIAGTATYYSSIYESRLERYENTVSDEFIKLRDEKLAFTNSMSNFTRALATEGVVDDEVRSEIDRSIISLHQRIDFFSAGLPSNDKDVLRKFQITLGDVKSSILTVSVKDDLNSLTGALVNMERAYQKVTPIIVGEAGRPGDIL